MSCRVVAALKLTRVNDSTPNIAKPKLWANSAGDEDAKPVFDENGFSATANPEYRSGQCQVPSVKGSVDDDSFWKRMEELERRSGALKSAPFKPPTRVTAKVLCAHPRCVTDPLLLHSLQRARVAFKQPRHCSRHRSTHPSLASSLGAVSVTSSRPHPSHLPQHPPRSAFNPHVT